jgi:hypothetical protein
MDPLLASLLVRALLALAITGALMLLAHAHVDREREEEEP